jgi:hypothetical protein
MRVLLTAVTLADLFFLIGMKLPQGSCTNCNGNTLEVVSLNATGNGYFGGTLYTPTKVCPCTGAWPDRYQPWNCPKLKRVHWGGTAETSSNFAIASRWGAGASCPSSCTVNYNPVDSSGLVTIKSGSGSVTANPKVTLTFADGSGTNDVLCCARRYGKRFGFVADD